MYLFFCISLSSIYIIITCIFTLCSVLYFIIFKGKKEGNNLLIWHPLSILRRNLNGTLQENNGKNFKLWREQALIYGDNILEISLYLKLDNETPSATERSQPGNAISWAGAFTEIAVWILQHATLSCHYEILAKFHESLSKCSNFFPLQKVDESKNTICANFIERI